MSCVASRNSGTETCSRGDGPRHPAGRRTGTRSPPRAGRRRCRSRQIPPAALVLQHQGAQLHEEQEGEQAPGLGCRSGQWPASEIRQPAKSDERPSRRASTIAVGGQHRQQETQGRRDQVIERDRRKQGSRTDPRRRLRPKPGRYWLSGRAPPPNASRTPPSPDAEGDPSPATAGSRRSSISPGRFGQRQHDGADPDEQPPADLLFQVTRPGSCRARFRPDVDNAGSAAISGHLAARRRGRQGFGRRRPSTDSADGGAAVGSTGCAEPASPRRAGFQTVAAARNAPRA